MTLNRDLRQRLARVLDYLFWDEEADFVAQDEPTDHIYRDLRALSDALASFNIKEAQQRRSQC